MYNLYGEKGNEDLCIANSQIVAGLQEDLRSDLVVSRPESEKKWYGTQTYKPNGIWDRAAEEMMFNFSEKWTSSIPWIQCLGRFDKQVEKENCLYTSVATTTALNWFFARSSPSVSSENTEQ